jgi:hypothetical protein
MSSIRTLIGKRCLATVSIAVVALFFSSSAAAEAPIYFDIFGLAKFVGGYLLGFVAICIAAWKAKIGSATKTTLIVLAVCYFPVPILGVFAFAAYDSDLQERQQIHRQEEMHRSEKAGRDALRRFCEIRAELPVCQERRAKNDG